MSKTSSGTPGANLPWTEYIESHIAEWGCRTDAIRGQVGHLLDLALPSQFLAFDALLKDAVDQSFSSYDPESTSADKAVSEHSSLVLCFVVEMSDHEC